MTSPLHHSDTFRIPFAIEEDGRHRVRPHEADNDHRYKCPACDCFVTTHTRKSRYFRHPVSAKSCNAKSVIHPFAVERMRILLDGVNRALLSLDFVEPRRLDEAKRFRYACPRGDATACNHHDQAHNRFFDVVNLSDDRPVMVVEIRYKHDVDDAKRLHMPQPWIELPADRFTHPDIDDAVVAIGQGRQAKALVLHALRRRVVTPRPPGEPKEPSEEDLLRRMRRYTGKVEKLRTSGSLDRGIVLQGETCPRHPSERLICKIPRSAWTSDEATDPVHQGAHILLRRQSTVVLGILLVGTESQINQLRGRRLATPTTIPLALIPLEQLRPLMKGVPVRLNSHAVNGPWSCSLCERAAMEARIRAQQDQQVASISAEIEAILKQYTERVANLSLPAEARVDQEIEREVDQWLSGAEDAVVARVGWAWRSTARSLQNRHRAQQQVIDEQANAWRQLQAPHLRRMEQLESREELVALAQELAGALPSGTEEPPDLSAVHARVHIEGQAAVSKRIDLITSPDWRMTQARKRISQRYPEAASASDAAAIIKAFANELRQIADNNAQRMGEAEAAIEHEREMFNRRCSWNADQAVRRIMSAWDTQLEKSTSIDAIERLRTATDQEIRRIGDQWQRPTDSSTAVIRRFTATRMMDVAPEAISTLSRQHASNPVDASTIASFKSDALAWIRQFIQRLSSVSTTEQVDASNAKLAKLVEREMLHLLEVQWHPRIWASWLPIRGDIKTRWRMQWSKRDRDLIEQFEALLRHHRIEPQWCPSPIRSACSIAASQATHWEIRRAIDDALVDASKVGVPLEPHTGRQQTIF